MARGISEEHNPKRRPLRTFKRGKRGIGYGTVGGQMFPGVTSRKPTDPIPPDELVEEIKKVFPGTIEVNNESEEPPTEYGEDGDMSYG